MLQQINPHVRTKFINPIHKNHIKYPIQLRFKCDFFFSLKINKTRKPLLFLSELCLRVQEHPEEPGRGVGAARSLAQNIGVGMWGHMESIGTVRMPEVLWGHKGPWLWDLERVERTRGSHGDVSGL